MKQFNSLLVPVVVMSLIISPATALAQSSGGGDAGSADECGCAAQGEVCVPLLNPNGKYDGAYQCECDDPVGCQNSNGTGQEELVQWGTGQVAEYLQLFPAGYFDQLGATEALAVSHLGTASGYLSGGEVIIETTVEAGEFVTRIFIQNAPGVKGKLLATAPKLAVLPGSFVGNGLKLAPRGATIVDTQWGWATRWCQVNGNNWTLHRVLAGGLTLAFAAAVILAYATPAIARTVLPITTARLEDFRTDCQMIHDYVKKIDIDQPYLNPRGQSNTCEWCYNKAYSEGTSAPSSATITTCAATMANQNATYNVIKEVVGELNEKAGTACASNPPDGYYTKRFSGPIRWDDRPNVTPIERVCPYR
ncbi:MAG: hypothetical protein JOZ62_16905 [Acidobacteriaceae bacterium]|nr:hypothetical protein [Acidobacteriaceae bacterium]